MKLYNSNDILRVVNEDVSRDVWRRDYARLVHCPSFRRLQGKTQLFPSAESDFFRNRLTHSIEVAQISKSIAIKLNGECLELKAQKINTDLVEFCALAHDLGHPPFGHQGEQQLDDCLIEQGGFEGNAQTLRILSKVEKKIIASQLIGDKDNRVGLNLCYRSLAGILKYDNEIPVRKSDREAYATNKKTKIEPVKGYYSFEKELVKNIKYHVTGVQNFNDKFKTIECSIMDVADDIAYSTYDLEDGLKAGFLNPIEMVFNYDIIEKIKKSVNNRLSTDLSIQNITYILIDIFTILDAKHYSSEIKNVLKDVNIDYETKFKTQLSNVLEISKQLGKNGFLRTQLTSSLVNMFIEGVYLKFNEKYPALSIVDLKENVRVKIEILKRFVYESQILSPRLKIVEFRGKQIVKELFEILSNDKNGFDLLPDDYRELYKLTQNKDMQRRLVADFIAGMTDRYALEFYGRINSDNPVSFFKQM